jgi:hypothetical protein
MTLAQLLDYEAFTEEGKLIYIKLNIPAPCPPRSVVPVNTRAWFLEFISSQHPSGMALRHSIPLKTAENLF